VTAGPLAAGEPEGGAPPADPGAWAREQAPPSVPGNEQLAFLVDDAAARAAAMLAAGAATASAEDADPLVDAVRMLATRGGAAYLQAASLLTGMEPVELRRLVLAHTRGGAGAVAAAFSAAQCTAADLEAAVAEVRASRALAVGDLEVAPGSVTDLGAGIRVRLGTDGRWHPFTSARGEWWPASGASPSAGGAYQAARRARSLRR